MIKNYIKNAFIHLQRHKVHSLINIFGLTIGLSVVVLITLYVNHEYSADKYHENYNNIYRLQTPDGAWTQWNIADIIREDIPEIDEVVRIESYRTKSVTMKYKNNLLTVKDCIYADDGFFDIFSHKVIEGNLSTALTDPMAIVLTEKEAKRLFGSESAVGKNIQYQKKYILHVTAVIEDVPQNTSIKFNSIISAISLKTLLGSYAFQWGTSNYHTYALIQEQGDLSLIQEKINIAIESKLPKERKGQVELELFPFKSLYFTEFRNPSSLIILSSVGLLILIIAIINFINLTVAKASTRAREVGVRKALGSKRSSLIKQFVTEAIVVSFIAVNISILLTNLLIPGLNSLSGTHFGIVFINSPLNWFLFICGSIILGFIAGLYPAFYLSKFQPVQVLKGKIHDGTKSLFLRKGLIVFQFVISISLIICTILIGKQLEFMQNQNLGFNKENIICIQGSSEIKSNFKIFKSELSKNPNITQVANSGYMPGLGGIQGWGGIKYKNRNGEEKQGNFVVNTVDKSFLELLDFELVKGKFFSCDTKRDSNSIIINETAVKECEIDNPVGTIIDIWGEDREIVGVVKDFHYKSMHTKIEPQIFVNRPDGVGYISIKIALNDNESMSNLIKEIRKQWDEFSPNFPMNYYFLDDRIDNFYKSEQRFGMIFKWFSILAILIACLGLFGLASFTVAKRTKEIGIRKVNGASVSNIFSLLIFDFTKWIILAFIISCILSYYAIEKWLTEFAYKTDISWWVFVISGLIAFLVALITITLQTYKAAVKNPVDALRFE